MEDPQIAAMLVNQCVINFIMVEQENIDWDLIREKLPFDRSPESKAKRNELWNAIDVNGNGYLSLAEVDKGLRDVLQCDNIFDCKPVIIRAFNAAKQAVKTSMPYGDDYVTRPEFRLLILYLYQYFVYYQAFCRIDTGDDRRIDKGEFVEAKDMLEKWVGPIEDPEATFDEIDQNGGGQILFDEFVEWAAKKNLELEEDDD